jgi:lipoprotein-anchoring transpeptidase ErfK/SrfK
VGAIGAAVIVAAMTVSACGTVHSGSSTATTRSAPSLSAHLAAAVTVSPANGTTNVAPNASVFVTTNTGYLTSVQVTPLTGASLTGSFNVDDTEWRSTGALAGTTTYQIKALVRSSSGATGTETSRFTTLTPTALVGATLWPDSGLSVGVGQPIVMKFSQPIITPTSRQSVLAFLHLSMSSPVPVGAYWFSPTELHLRPQNFWPSGEQITFSDALGGWDAGSGEWGQGTDGVSFTIGDARISTANLATDQMTVTDNGQLVATYPISAGRDQYPTMDGTHIVLDRESQVQMISSSVGIPVNSPNGYDETVYSDVHISDSGEYVHAAPWSVAAQGNTNVSHGCINVSPANAAQFFNFSRVGDIVNVVGGPRPPEPGDHGVVDWSTPWTSFTPVAVSPLTPPPATAASS